MKKIAFIGGTGAENSVLLKDVTEHIIETPYGEAKYEAGFFEDREIIHLSRHGRITRSHRTRSITVPICLP